MVLFVISSVRGPNSTMRRCQTPGSSSPVPVVGFPAAPAGVRMPNPSVPPWSYAIGSSCVSVLLWKYVAREKKLMLSVTGRSNCPVAEY